MRSLYRLSVGWVLILSAGCGPTFNWREVGIGNTRLVAMFPCKPQLAQRRVTMVDQDVQLTLRSCDADGVTLAVGHARLANAAQRARVLMRWRDATLAGMRAEPASISATAPRRLQALPDLVAVRAYGKSPSGDPVTLQGLWFAQDAEIFSALLVAREVNAEVEESFFSGLQLR